MIINCNCIIIIVIIYPFKHQTCIMPPTQKPHCQYGQDSKGNCNSAPNQPCPNGLQWNQQFSRCVQPGSGNPYEANMESKWPKMCY